MIRTYKNNSSEDLDDSTARQRLLQSNMSILTPNNRLAWLSIYFAVYVIIAHALSVIILQLSIVS